ncbi:MAG: two-component regulator propeller domain-containing protein [Acidobacteriota bacterium]
MRVCVLFRIISKYLPRGCWRWLTALLFGALASSLLSNAVWAQYRFDNWTTEQGLPQNSVLAITQTRDGYLWLATYNGLVRFDGVRFTVFDKGNTRAFSTSRISDLGEDATGALWIGTTEGGVLHYQNGVFTAFTREQGLPHNNIMVMGIQRGPDDIPLIITEAGAVWWRNGRFSPYEVSGSANELQILLGRSGTHWLVDKNGVSARKDGQIIHYAVPVEPEAMPGTRSYEDRSGALWLALPHHGVSRIKDGVVTDYTERLKLGFATSISAILEDVDGSFWFGTPNSGLIHFKERTRDGETDTVTVYTTANGLSSNGILKLFQDRESSLWIGTDGGGLSRVNRQFISGYSEAQGLAGNVTDAIMEDRAGNVWVVTQSGLGKIANGVVTNYVPGQTTGGLPRPLQTVHEDRAGRLWIGGWTGLYLFKDGVFSMAIPDINVHSLHEDRQGNLWIGTHYGLIKLKDGVKTIYRIKDGLPNDIIRVIHEDRHGALWFGTEGGLAKYAEGRFSAFTTKDGLASNRLWSIHEDAEGVLWLGTFDGGLMRFKAGRFTSYTVAQGLYNNGVFQILDDGRGNLWMSCYRGIYRVSKQQLDAFAEGKLSAITSTAFGKADGMLSSDCNGGRQPSGIRTNDGRLWFTTLKGIAVLNPEELTVNPTPPPVLIENAMLDRAVADIRNGLRVAPGQSNLEITFTALSFIKAEQTRFKYRLVGQDPDWIEASTRRTANYSYLRPGQYTFKVIAANSDGVWNNQGAQLQVVVLPAFYQTWWFRLLGLLAVAGSIGLVFKRRLDQAHRARRAQEAFSRQLIESQEAERKRIAAELHDSLGQNLLVIKNYALMALNTGNGENPMREHVTEISDAATLSIEEVRQIAHNLRPYQLERLGLTNTLQTMLRQIANASDIGFTCEVDSIDGLLSKENEISFYRIVQEAINNILKHSGASEASVRIKLVGDEIQATIADDGRGFTLEPVGKAELQKRGFGLTGSAERVRMLGGVQTIQTAPGQGTAIHITIQTNKHAGKQ